jgi:hypothetical protein
MPFVHSTLQVELEGAGHGAQNVSQLFSLGASDLSILTR